MKTALRHTIRLHPAHIRLHSSSSSSSSSPTATATATATYYALFPHTLPRGPPPHGPFNIDGTRLHNEFLQLQSRAHPDKHLPSAKRAAQDASAHINEAYRTLRSPLARATYLLSLAGKPVGEEGEGEGEGAEDAELLGEVMGVREEIEDGEKAVGLSRAENEARIRDCEARLGEAFGERDFGRAGREVRRLRYWVSIRQALDGREE
ncbi:MAG: hypothetical protein M1829_006952 [Trizodia sp. TS-e1964]|nr:MAG: hypothetical protein M1829_006952 [Trizodia sp. TS-e1964]